MYRTCAACYRARISPDDADLSVGQRTLIRFPTLHERDLPDLRRQLTRLSTDALTNNKTGATYFIAEIIMAEEQLRVLRGLHGSAALRVGMPVQVLGPLRARTALGYALEPLVGSFRVH